MRAPSASAVDARPRALPAAEFPTTEPLSMERVLLLRDMAKPYEFPTTRR